MASPDLPSPCDTLRDMESGEPIPGFARQVLRQAFRGLIGRAMFCQLSSCGAVLDCRRAVEIESTEGDRGSLFVCAKCYDRWLAAAREFDDASEYLAGFKVTDGRALYRRTRRTRDA